jgi:hypothetical protein
MIAPVIELAAKYDDVYLWDIPFAPPAELLNNLSREERALFARSTGEAFLTHALRIANQGPAPWTTGPALVFQKGRVVAQGMMTYTSVGNSNDLEVTAAADIHTKRTDRQTEFTPDAIKLRHTAYSRIDLAGTLTLTNFRDHPVHVEVRRAVLGHVDEADQEGQTIQLNWMEDWSYRPGRTGMSVMQPFWMWRYNWPWWWGHLNGIGEVTWEFELLPGQTKELTYAWHYFWQ